MGFFSDKCPECGAVVRKRASFCPACGKPAPKADVLCPACGKQVKATAKFCPGCGARIRPESEEAPAVDAMNRWKRASDEFARRIEANDLRGLLHRSLVVEPGTQALIFQGGAMAAVVSQGTYDLNRPLEGVDLVTPATAILIDAGEVGLPLAYRGLRTREDVPVDVAVEIVVRLGDASRLHANLMHGSESLSIRALAGLVAGETANVLEARLKGASVEDLDGNLELKHTLEADLQQQIGEALRRNGLELAALRRVQFSCEQLERVRSRRGETFVAEQKADDAERRGQLNRRLRETLTRDRMDQFTSAKDFEQFIRQTEHELGMKEVVRQAEMEDLCRTYAEKKDDAEIARRHLLQKLELEHELAVRRGRHAIDDEDLQHTLKHERENLRARQEAEWQEAEQRQRVRDLQRAGEVSDAEVEMRIREKKFELGKRAREWKVAQDHEEESLRVQREQEAKDREAKRELEKIHALSQVEQARLAADLKKTEAMKDMSEEQILALMSKNSPHVAAAIAERAKAQAQAGANAETKALYEKFLADKDAAADRLERFAERALTAMERASGSAAAREREQKEEIRDMAGQSMDRMADVAEAKAAASGGTAAQEASVVCTQCHQQVPAGSKFCDNCGNQFYQ